MRRIQSEADVPLVPADVALDLVVFLVGVRITTERAGAFQVAIPGNVITGWGRPVSRLLSVRGIKSPSPRSTMSMTSHSMKEYRGSAWLAVVALAQPVPGSSPSPGRGPSAK